MECGERHRAAVLVGPGQGDVGPSSNIVRSTRRDQSSPAPFQKQERMMLFPLLAVEPRYDGLSKTAICLRTRLVSVAVLLPPLGQRKWCPAQQPRIFNRSCFPKTFSTQHPTIWALPYCPPIFLSKTLPRTRMYILEWNSVSPY